jgi:hypothetical protein
MASGQDNSPANGRGGSSYIYKLGTSPNTRVAVSQKVRILAPSYGDDSALFQIGLITNFNPSESRTIDPVRGIGFGDQVAELVPGVTNPREASVDRALMYLSSLWQATGYAAGVDGPVRSLRHHRWPFDVEHQLVFSTLADNDLGAANTGYSAGSGTFEGGVKSVTYPQVTGTSGTVEGGHTVIVTLYEACWWNQWSATIAADQAMITESGSMTITDVHDFSSIYGEFMPSGNDPTIGQLGSSRFTAGRSGGSAF